MKRVATQLCLTFRSATGLAALQAWRRIRCGWVALIVGPALAQTPAWELPVIGAEQAAATYSLQPVAPAALADVALAWPEDPSLRILARTHALPLNFALVAASDAWAAWSPEPRGAAATSVALAAGLPLQASDEPFMRLWIPLSTSGQRLRLTHAFVNLIRPGYADGDMQWRPSAGVVMRLGSGPAYLQQLSLGSVFRLNVGEGAQLALRLRGGRLGLQYRLQFTL
jgi:hypothetical protein